MAVHYLGTNSSDGTCVGKSATEKVGFFGADPITRPSDGDQATVRTTALDETADNATNTTVHGNIVSDLNAAKTLVNQLRSDMVSVGLIKGS